MAYSDLGYVTWLFIGPNSCQSESVYNGIKSEKCLGAIKPKGPKQDGQHTFSQTVQSFLS